MKMSLIKITIVLLASMATANLHANVAGDAARTSAATAAAAIAHENVKKMYREIELKRAPLGAIENASQDIRLEHEQFKKKIVTMQQRVISLQQLLKSTQDKADQIIKKTNLHLQDSQPLLAVLHQGNKLNVVATAQSAVAKLQATINDVSGLLKNQQAALENMIKTTTALEQ